MIYFARWKVILILFVCVMALFYSSPNMMSSGTRDWLQTNMPGWVPSKSVNLGLDLQGGAHLLLEVDIDSVMKKRAEGFMDTVRPELRKEKIGYVRIGALPLGVRVNLRDPAQAETAKKLITKLDQDFEVILSQDKKTLEAHLTEDAMRVIGDQVIGQSIEVVRRRVDETGTKEPTIQRQGKNRIIVQLPGVDNPEEIKELLKKTAQLTFHLVDQDLRGSMRAGGGSLTLPMADDPAQTIRVGRRELITGDMLTKASFCNDQFGNPAVCFRFNGQGTRRFCDVTRQHVNEPFAIVLDKEVISAPNINEPICGGSGQISGSFSVQEANDLALLLRAGALPADLTFVEERTVGPSLGADSVEAGKIASLVGLAFVIAFMAASYGLFGVLADLALLMNVALIFAVLSGLQATLTLPGIAGIVLTVGMAVDANVLIFERIREEIRNGRSPISAVDAGYSRAMATIVDSNLTTLIAAVILYSFGTGPIKGFAVTLAIGIMTSLFSAIMLTRLMVVTWLTRKKPAELPL